MRVNVIALFAILFLTPVAGSAQAIPNPIQVTYDFHGAKTYSVDCWSVPGTRGFWVPITETTFTTQEAVLVPAAPPNLNGQVKPPALYCFAADGKPGIIAGAPPGLMLAPHSRIVHYSDALIMMTQNFQGRRNTMAVSVPLDGDTRIDAGASGIAVQQGAHTLTIYPAGSRLTIGGGASYGFFRPGEKLGPVPNNVDLTGCTVSYMSESNTVTRTQHYDKLCPQVPIPQQQ